MTETPSQTLAKAAKFREIRRRAKEQTKAAHEANKGKAKDGRRVKPGIFDPNKYTVWL